MLTRDLFVVANLLLFFLWDALLTQKLLPIISQISQNMLVFQQVCAVAHRGGRKTRRRRFILSLQ